MHSLQNNSQDRTKYLQKSFNELSQKEKKDQLISKQALSLLPQKQQAEYPPNLYHDMTQRDQIKNLQNSEL